MTLNNLERRIIELSYINKLSHISSCLNTINLLSEIYAKKAEDDIVILANGHAGLALYVVLESLGLCNAQEMIDKHGVHPSRDPEHGIHCSSGSLGQAETISLGLAMADPSRTVWLVTSDGSCAEGSAYEAMRVKRKYCSNLKVFVVWNGYGAYGKTDVYELPVVATIVRVDDKRYPLFLQGLGGHYVVLNDAQYQELMA